MARLQRRWARTQPPPPAAPRSAPAARRAAPAEAAKPGPPAGGWLGAGAMLMSRRLYGTCPAGRAHRDDAAARQPAMPRSFLVKKPSSTRVPNYGQLETRRQGKPAPIRPRSPLLGGRPPCAQPKGPRPLPSPQEGRSRLPNCLQSRLPFGDLRQPGGLLASKQARKNCPRLASAWEASSTCPASEKSWGARRPCLLARRPDLSRSLASPPSAVSPLPLDGSVRAPWKAHGIGARFGRRFGLGRRRPRGWSGRSGVSSFPGGKGVGWGFGA